MGGGCPAKRRDAALSQHSLSPGLSVRIYWHRGGVLCGDSFASYLTIGNSSKSSEKTVKQWFQTSLKLVLLGLILTSAKFLLAFLSFWKGYLRTSLHTAGTSSRNWEGAHHHAESEVLLAKYVGSLDGEQRIPPNSGLMQQFCLDLNPQTEFFPTQNEEYEPAFQEEHFSEKAGSPLVGGNASNSERLKDWSATGPKCK